MHETVQYTSDFIIIYDEVTVDKTEELEERVKELEAKVEALEVLMHRNRFG